MTLGRSSSAVSEGAVPLEAVIVAVESCDRTMIKNFVRSRETDEAMIQK